MPKADARLKALDKKHLWHPFTQMKDWEKEDPLVIASGKGNYLFDTNGRRYLDGVSSIWVNLHGHRKAALDRAIKNQLKKVAHSTLLGLTSPPAILLAAELARIAPKGLTRVFYSDDGSTAMEAALKMALQYWRHKGEGRRTRFVSLVNAYHGDTVGSVSLGGIDLFHETFRPILFKTIKAPSPYCYRCPFNLRFPDCGIACAEEIEKIFQDHRGEVAALVVEPLVQAAAGMVMPPHGHLRRLRELCDRHRVLLIADEVATGFGRTGKMFACQHEGVTPDLMAVAKGLTGGYLPLAATLTTEEIYRAFLGEYAEFKTFFHGHSYTGNPLGCAAALANLGLLRTDGILGKVRAKAKYLSARLKPLASSPHVGQIRQRGLMAGIELVQDKREKRPYPLERRVGHRVSEEARSLGVLLRPLGNVIVLMPPLSVTLREIDRLVRTVEIAIEKVTAEPAGNRQGSGRRSVWGRTPDSTRIASGSLEGRSRREGRGDCLPPEKQGSRC
jgi:adenosylmethionine-8-amino-7-oxononanoate aminotransferase